MYSLWVFVHGNLTLTTMDGKLMYNFFIAKNTEQLQDAYRLRYNVFVREEGMYPSYNSSKQYLYDEFDALCPDTWILNAYYYNQIVATIRLARESSNGSPADNHYDFSLYRDLWRKNGYQNAVFGSATMLAIREDHRHKIRLFQNLMYLSAQKCVDAGVTNVLILPKYATSRIYRKIGFHEIDRAFFDPKSNSKIIPMAITTEHFYESVTRNEYIHIE